MIKYVHKKTIALTFMRKNTVVIWATCLFITLRVFNDVQAADCFFFFWFVFFFWLSVNH